MTRAALSGWRRQQQRRICWNAGGCGNLPKTYPRTQPGWTRQYQYGRGVRFVHKATGRCVMRPIDSRWWYIYAGDGTKDQQPYSTWIDAVRAADESLKPRKEQDGKEKASH